MGSRPSTVQEGYQAHKLLRSTCYTWVKQGEEALQIDVKVRWGPSLVGDEKRGQRHLSVFKVMPGDALERYQPHIEA